MNREIKFRAMSGQEWVYGYFCKDYAGIGYITTLDGVSTSTVNANTVGQFTGLKDVSGTDIYDGDVDSMGYIVGWVEKSACYGLYNDGRVASYPIYQGQIKIIGNIHQNPELL